LGSPPLTFHAGAVLGTSSGPGDVTVTPVLWDPQSAFSSSYTSLVEGYVQNVASDSGRLTNVFSDFLQYGIAYDVSSGDPITDTNPYPQDGCVPDTGATYTDSSGFAVCLTDSQVATELTDVLQSRGVTPDMQNLYMVLLPEGTEICFTSADGTHRGSCNDPYSRNAFCGYHSAANTTSPPVYAVLPYPVDNVAAPQTCVFSPTESPNDQPAADTIVSTLSHELMESISDPFGSGWFDSKGYEVADECNFIFGESTGGSAGSKYNQTIAGADYMTQEEFSNEDYEFSRSTACVQHVDLPSAVVKARPGAAEAGRAVSLSAARVKGNVAELSWDFGDGTPPETGSPVSHVYSTAGSYTVVLTLTDTDGAEMTVETTVTVSH
jgi:PKD repeat protein